MWSSNEKGENSISLEAEIVKVTPFCEVGSCPKETGFQNYLSTGNTEVWRHIAGRHDI